MDVHFEFSPDEKVMTPLGDLAIVDTCAIDGSGINKVYVNIKGGTAAWFEEKQLMKAPA